MTVLKYYKNILLLKVMNNIVWIYLLKEYQENKWLELKPESVYCLTFKITS